MNIKNSIGMQACIEILKWLRPRILGSLICLLVIFFCPIFILQAFFVSDSKDLWVDRLFRWVDPDSKL